MSLEQSSVNLQLIYSLRSEEKWLDFQLDTLIQMRPSWSLEAAIRIQDQKEQLVLQCKGLKTAETIDAFRDYTSELGLIRLAAILEAYQSARDALFSSDQIALDPSQVFFEPESGLVHLAIIPVSAPMQTGSIDTLAQSIANAYHIDDDTLAQKIGAIHPLSQTVDPPAVNEQPAGTLASNPGQANPTTIPCEQSDSNKNRRKIQVLLILAHFLTLLIILWPWLSYMELAWLPFSLTIPDRFLVWYIPARVFLAVGLIILDLWLSRPRPHLTRIIRFGLKALRGNNKSAEKGTLHAGSQTACVADLTQVLQVQSSAYRLGMLSFGLPGTPQEAEGLRAYILVDEFLIGRDDAICDLPLPAASVGRRHARITRREGSFFITDLGSKNGTRLDGRNLNKHEDYLLPDRCRVEFADQAFYFLAD